MRRISRNELSRSALLAQRCSADGNWLPNKTLSACEVASGHRAPTEGQFLLVMVSFVFSTSQNKQVYQMENTSRTSLNPSSVSEANPAAITAQTFEGYKAAVRRLYSVARDWDADNKKNTSLRDSAIGENTSRRDSGISATVSWRDSANKRNASQRDDSIGTLEEMSENDKGILFDLRKATAKLLSEPERAALVTERNTLQKTLDGSRLVSSSELHKKSWSKEDGCSWGCGTTIVIGIITLIAAAQPGVHMSAGGIFLLILFYFGAGFIIPIIRSEIHNSTVDSGEQNNARIQNTKSRLDDVKKMLGKQKSLDDEIFDLRRKGRLVDFSSMLLAEAAFAEKTREIDAKFSKRKNEIGAEFSKRNTEIEGKYTEDRSAIYRASEEKAEMAHDKFNKEKQAIAGKYKALWDDAVKALAMFPPAIAKAQPAFKEFPPFVWLENLDRFPAALVIGDVLVARNQEGFSTSIPILFQFPFTNALLSTADTSPDCLSAIVWRLLVSLPVGGLHFTVCDPLKLGKSFQDFLTLTDAGEALFTGGKVLTAPAEVTAGIDAEFDELTRRTQQHLRDGSSWAEYNSKTDMPLPYRLLLVFDAPEALSHDSLGKLAGLIERGPRNGILPVLAMKDNWQTDSRGRNNDEVIAWKKENEKHFQGLEEVAPSFYKEYAGSDSLKFSSDPELPKSQETKKAILKEVVTLYTKQKKQTRPVTALWGGKPEWKEDGSVPEFLEIPLGWRDNGLTAVLRIGGDKPHTLLAGKPGSGKSNLLHVLLHSLAHHYSPEQARVFLLDYKQGTEMAVYARHKLPHAMLVATESDVEFGVSVLQRIEAEIQRRADVFKEAGIKDFPDQEEKIPREKRFPRWLCIIDEFQVLFGEDRANAAATEKLMEMILKQGRAFGLHVILSTQTLRGLSGTGFSQMYGQIANRLCLACDPMDSNVALGNPDASLLNSPPEALVNEKFGAREANVVFRVPEAKAGICEEHLERLREHANATARAEQAPRVFSGESLPGMPGAEMFAKEAAGAKTPVLLLGRRLNYEEELMSCKLQRRAGSNLLCLGGGDSAALRGGLLRSLAQSMAAARGEALLMSLRDEEEQVNLSEFFADGAGLRDLSSAPEAEIAAALELPAERLETPRFLIIDGLDFARIFRSEGYKPTQAAAALKKYLAEGLQKSCWTIAFGDDWKRLREWFRDLIPEFGIRVGYCMSESNAGMFFGDNIKGLEKANRAFFKDDVMLKESWFRPFAVPDQETDRK